jgi:hypothetical protein
MRMIILHKIKSPLCPLKGRIALKELAKIFNAIAPLRGMGVSRTTHNLS